MVLLRRGIRTRGKPCRVRRSGDVGVLISSTSLSGGESDAVVEAAAVGVLTSGEGPSIATLARLAGGAVPKISAGRIVSVRRNGVRASTGGMDVHNDDKGVGAGADLVGLACASDWPRVLLLSVKGLGQWARRVGDSKGRARGERPGNDSMHCRREGDEVLTSALGGGK